MIFATRLIMRGAYFGIAGPNALKAQDSIARGNAPGRQGSSLP